MREKRAKPSAPEGDKDKMQYSAAFARMTRTARLAALLLAGAACAGSLPPAARADTAAGFDQPPLPLAQALNRIAERAGISVVIEGSAAGLTSPALRGPLTLDGALEAALAGSGASYGFTSDGSLTVRLPAAPDEDPGAGVKLGTIVLSATGHPQQLADAPAAMTVIPSAGLETRATASLADLMRNVPGLAVSGPGREGLPAITLRGMGQPYVLFMIDGRPLSASEEASYNGHGLNSKIGFLPPVAALDRIEIIRGPISALHGSGASGGVINVITRDIPETWGGSVTLGRSIAFDRLSGGGGEGRFFLGGPLTPGGLGLSVYGSANTRAEDDRAATGYLSQGQGAARRTILGARLRWAPDAVQSFDLDLQQSRLGFSRTLLSARAASETLVRDRMASLTHRIAWSGRATTTSFLQWEETDFRSGYVSGHDALTFNTRSSLAFGEQTLSFGYEYRFERTRHAPERLIGSPGTSPERWHQSLFVEGDLRLAPDLKLTLGLRGDRNENYGSALTPRLWLVWHLSPELTLKGGIGSGYRVPALKQADDAVAEPSGGDGRSRDRGNSALRPERSTNHEIGLMWERPSGLQFGATLFHTRFTDRIARTDLCRTPAGEAPACPLNGVSYVAVTQYVNEDSARLRGVELTLDVPLGDLRLNANYTWSDSKVTRGRNLGRPFHNLPRHMLNLGFDWAAGERLSLWGQARARSRAAALGRSAEIPGHVILDLGLTWEVTEAVSGALALYNVTGKTLDDVLPDGRRLWLGLSAEF
ncbi:TonB-dependent receptor [Pseudogemmobacter humi]|uniref:Colicin I receptor n=1 Tax=Pseudogemmobacter humi TaxID=2483812 RepID=A0A3P5WPL6_9RHOB|nr:TonB-dependent receptor [Pseudogemmobacter humi]VDC22932.1 Colicin I receptor precursor [Pseudogemmobacter humi]